MSSGPATQIRRRPSRWDRPKPPKDWRWWVGGIGRVLITLGVLMFAFVAYQLWGTGLQTARAQDKLDREFERVVAERRAAEANSETSTSPPATGPVTTDPVAGTTASTTAGTTPRTTTSPSIDFGDFGAGLNVLPAEGEVVARIVIPSIGVDYKVVQGVARNDLKKGPGHMMETPMPGELGNVAIAAHRTSYAAPFADLDDVKPGDIVELTDLSGDVFRYAVTETVIVRPTDYAELVPTKDPTKATVTLITCHPEYSTRERLAVRAELDLSSSPAPVAPTATLPAPTSDTLPGDDLGDDVPGTGLVDGAIPDPGAPTTADAAAQSADFLSAGWFSDPAAWPHVGMWGAGLVAWVVMCYVAARTLRRAWVGVLIGFIPFVVLLYFWFENVNRLLPPNL